MRKFIEACKRHPFVVFECVVFSVIYILAAIVLSWPWGAFGG